MFHRIPLYMYSLFHNCFTAYRGIGKYLIYHVLGLFSLFMSLMIPTPIYPLDYAHLVTVMKLASLVSIEVFRSRSTMTWEDKVISFVLCYNIRAAGLEAVDILTQDNFPGTYLLFIKILSTNLTSTNNFKTQKRN